MVNPGLFFTVVMLQHGSVVFLTLTKIAEVKRKHGLELQTKKEVEVKYPCPPEKVEAIEDALRYYKVIE